MPISVDYTPVGTIGSLAQAAGRARGQAQRMNLIMSLHQAALASQQASAQHASRMAEAVAQREAARAMRSPVARHVSTVRDAAYSRSEASRDPALAHLQTMLESGSITPQQYEQAKLGITARVPGLISAAFQPQRPTISPSDELGLLARHYGEQRQSIENELRAIRTSLADPLAPDALKQQAPNAIATLQSRLAAINAAEQKDIGQFRQTGVSPLGVQPAESGGTPAISGITVRRTGPASLQPGPSGEVPWIEQAMQKVGSSRPVRITTDEEYEALAPGTNFVGPDGISRRKP